MVLKDSVGGQEGVTRPDRPRVGGQAESASRVRVKRGRAGRRGSVCGKWGAYTGKVAEIRIEKFYVLRRRKTHGPDVAGSDSGSGSSSGSDSRLRLQRRAAAPNLLPPPADQANRPDERVRGAGRGARLARRCGPAPRPPVPPLLPSCVPLRRGAGPTLSPPSSPPPAAGRTRLPLPLGPPVSLPSPNTVRPPGSLRARSPLHLRRPGPLL